jgi:hypothetical protein
MSSWDACAATLARVDAHRAERDLARLDVQGPLEASEGGFAWTSVMAWWPTSGAFCDIPRVSATGR